VFDVVDKLANPFHPNLSFGEMQATLQKLNAMTRTFPPDPNAAAARVAHDALASWMDKIPQKFVAGGNATQAMADLRAANLGYKASMDFKKINTQIEEAILRNQTGRVEDLSGKLKDTFKPLVRDLDRGKWRPSPEVAAAVRKTATGSTYGLRSLGKLTPQSGIPMYAELGMALAGHPWKAILSAGGGAAARRAEQAIVMGRAQKALGAAAAQHPATAAFGSLNPVPRMQAAHALAAGQPAGRALRQYVPAMALRRVSGPTQDAEQQQ
jgi:hypothetical protein